MGRGGKRVIPRSTFIAGLAETETWDEMPISEATDDR